ncbi:MAG: OmpA family protein [Prevotella sp.]|jgi:outer membrane protein OmpA-like peptidoglycan-associated protein|nr:OmpA family protein [Prevotella sp.]
MKKFLMILAFASVSMASMAQEDPTLKYSVATNSFWQNWFVQVNASWNAFYSNEEKGADFAKGPFKDFRSAPGFSVAVGKWFTPGLGLRTKFAAMNGRSVISENKDINDIKFWNLQEQALFNLSNMLCGYSDTRVWNFIPYAGVGITRNCSYNTYELASSLGLLNTWKLSKRVLLNLDLGFTMCGDDFEGRLGSKRYVDLGGKGGEPSPSNHDRWFTAELGLTFNLGRVGWDKTPDVDAIKALSQSQIDALNAQLNDANAENARLNGRLREALANQKPAETPKAVREFVTTPVSVFFNLDKTNIASQKDLVNIEGVAKYAKENNTNLLVTGYADSATGKADHNQWLSEERAKTVAEELVKMGVSRDKIETVGKGGVDELSPISFNRRATVQVK